MSRPEEIGEGDLIASRYRLERHLGRGGMGTVWLATDAELDDLPVAIKMIRPELVGDAQFIAGLKAEAKSSLALTHPNIVRVFNLHRDDAHPDLTFLVLKYIEGETMKQLLAGSPQGLAPERMLKWAGQIAGALDYANSAGVLHRDLKPSNVMINTSSDTAYLVDFGISRQLGATMSNSDAGSSVGTPAYMSPQQLHEKDCTSNDIYSFAATLYEALCGRPPFGGPDLEEQILRVHAKPIPGVDEEINDALLAGLAKTEEERPGSAAQLVEWMHSGLTGAQQRSPALAPPSTSIQAPERIVAAPLSKLPIGAIAAAVVVVGGFVVGRTPRIATPIHDLLGMRPALAQTAPAVLPPEPSLATVDLADSSEPVATPIEWTRDDAPKFIELVRKGQAGQVRDALNSATSSNTVGELLEVLDPNTGYAAIHEAASHGNNPMLRILVDAGARVDQPAAMPQQLTPLHVAVRSKHLSTVELLITLGAPVDSEAGGRNTPLHLIAEHTINSTDLEFIKALVDGGADPTRRNSKGATPADLVPLTSKVRREALELLQR